MSWPVFGVNSLNTSHVARNWISGLPARGGERDGRSSLTRRVERDEERRKRTAVAGEGSRWRRRRYSMEKEAFL
jgi:hypothetical protein